MNMVGIIFSNLVAKTNWTIPSFNFQRKTVLEKIRIQQWNQYQKQYKRFVNVLVDSTRLDEEKISIIDLSAIGQKLNIEKIQEKIFVPAKTKLALMCCVDEATQNGDFVAEENLQGHLLGTISDPNTPRYLIDVPGSGALLYDTEHSTDRSKHNLLEIENKKMDEISDCIVQWCKKNEIIKFTVTYHQGCGAVRKRFTHNPELCEGDELDFAKKMAQKTAQSIHLKSLEYNYPLEITTAFIGDNEMCKCRPSELHNALGTAACLDSRVSVGKLDKLTGTNFFDVSVFDDMLDDVETNKSAQNFLGNAVHDIELTINIATGTHGWNNQYFDKRNPYPVMLFVGNTKQENEAKKIFNLLQKVFTVEVVDKLGFYIIRTDL